MEHETDEVPKSGPEENDEIILIQIESPFARLERRRQLLLMAEGSGIGLWKKLAREAVESTLEDCDEYGSSKPARYILATTLPTSETQS